MKTITKQHLAQRILKANGYALSHIEGETIVDSVFEILTSTLLKKQIICIKNTGFICPVYKKERTGVRNPKAKESAVMGAHWTATWRTSKNEHPSLAINDLRNLLRNTLIEKKVLENKSSRVDKTFVSEIVDILFEAIRSVATGDYRIEVRGFGVLRPVFQKARTARNPKTGESVQVGEHFKINFRLSTVLHKNLNGL